MYKMLDIGTFLSEASKLIYTGVKISLSNAVGGICCFVAVIIVSVIWATVENRVRGNVFRPANSYQELHSRIPDHLYSRGG